MTGPAILLVDDDPAFLRDFSESIADQVGTVHCARNRVEAQRVLGATTVDIVICDLVLAESDGLLLLEWIRGQWPSIGRVLLTGFGELLVGRNAFPAAQAVVNKPCDASSLVSLLRALPAAVPAAERVPHAGRSAAGEPLRWHTRVRGNGEVCVSLEGSLNESADLGRLDLPAGPLVLELGGLRFINSSGAHQLVLLLELLRQNALVAAECCSPAVVTMLNLLPTLSRRIQVRSVVAPFECGKCFAQCQAVLEVGLGRPPVLPELPCPECGGTMELADLEERYFAFLEQSA